MLSINQSSGNANAQANVIAIGIGSQANAVAESVLATSAPRQAAPKTARVREASVSEGAFHGARGVVQINQTAGSNNRTSNQFALQVQTGSKP